MTSLRALCLLALLAVVPAATAHGENPDGAYEPLSIDLHAYLATGGLVMEAPADGALRFDPPPRVDEENPALDFEILAPQAFFTQRGVTVTLVLRVGAPQAGRGVDGASVEATLLRNGEPIDGASARATLEPLLSPGTYELELPLAPPATLYAEGDRVGIRVRPLMPLGPQHEVALAIGEEGSRAGFEALRLGNVAELGLAASAAQVVYHLGEEQFAPASPGAQVITLQLTHERATLSAAEAYARRPLYVLVVTDEPTEVAEAEHEAFTSEARRERSHRYRVGDETVYAYPGVGVAVRVDRDTDLSLRCETRCPAGGFEAIIRIVPAPSPPQDQASALIPPPADDAPPSVVAATPVPEARDETPAAPLVGVLAAASLAALRRR